MAMHWKELLPVDCYMVRTNYILQDYDRKILTLLYQPLIGANCYSLYMTLWGEMDVNRLWGEKNKHHHLMSIMQLNLKQIFEERKKLEGIGLLKTYLKEDETDTIRTFIYELQQPLSPHDFFNDGVLNIYLYNRLGKTSFNKVKQSFADRKFEERSYNDVTSSFNDVFLSLNPSELTVSNPEMTDALAIDENVEFAHREESAGIFISEDFFDFSLFFAGISEALIPKTAFTAKVKEVIAKLSFVYTIDPIEMKKIVIQALDENDQINIEELRKAARDRYQFINDDKLPKLVYKTQPIQQLSSISLGPLNEEDQLVKQLDRVSPNQLLVSLSEGGEPTLADLQIIENIMINQQLNPGVVNVLIHYVMLKTDMKLSKQYVEKIAGHWARKQIKTVKEAMKLAKEEHRQYQEWAVNKDNKENKRTKTVEDKFSRNKMNQNEKRRLLMLGAEGDKTSESAKQPSKELTEKERQKRKQKMLDLLEGKGD